jgi:sigma-B regulation protein RsbU (phosphoserine phosphatase)
MEREEGSRGTGGTGGISLRSRMALMALAGVLALVVVGLLVRAAWVEVDTATKAVQNAAPADRDTAIEGLAGVARRLAVALAVAGTVIVALLVSAYFLLRAWILTPLDELRRQLREVGTADHRNHVIVPTGPPELRAAGLDAEAMRRALVREADSARAAEGSLALEGPVVSAIRDELDTEPDPTAARLEIHGRLHPAEGVLAGDWWGVVPLPDERTGLVLVDVSGHGALAGIVSLRLRSVMSVALRSGFDAGTALERAATSFDDESDGRFATALVVVLDPAAATLSWANAGHPAGWLLPDGRTSDRMSLGRTGPLVSGLGGSWETRRAPLLVGDVLLAWSDGLVEARDAAREVGEDELARRVEETGTRVPSELVSRLLAGLRERAPEWSRDDVTLVAVRRTS